MGGVEEDNRALQGLGQHACLDDLRAAMLRAIADPEMADMTLRSLAILLLVSDDGFPANNGVLARHLKIPRPAVTRAFDALYERGLLKREYDPDNRRTVRGRLTEHGRTLVRKAGARSRGEQA